MGAGFQKPREQFALLCVSLSILAGASIAGGRRGETSKLGEGSRAPLSKCFREQP